MARSILDDIKIIRKVLIFISSYFIMNDTFVLLLQIVEVLVKKKYEIKFFYKVGLCNIRM